MTQELEINVDGSKIGSVTFKENPSALAARRIAGNFALYIPASVNLRLAHINDPWPLLSDLWGALYTKVSSGSLVEIGRWTDNQWYQGAVPEKTTQASFIWRGTIADLAYFESIRNGQIPQLSFEVHGQFCYLLSSGHARYQVRTEPRSIFGQVEITYSAEIWVKMLRSLQVAENVLVEIPLPTSPPSPWDQVWRALVEARNAFEQGGTTGWKGCVTAVRLALEQWQMIEKEDMGPGWNPPGQQDRRNRTRQQRLDNLRWHLLQIAHLGAHSGADDWSRDDALLMLSTLSTMLAERKP